MRYKKGGQNAAKVDIIASLGKGLYRIKNISSDLVLKNTVHSARLKKYFPSHQASPLQVTNPDVIELPLIGAKHVPSDQLEEVVCHRNAALMSWNLTL